MLKDMDRALTVRLDFKQLVEDLIRVQSTCEEAKAMGGRLQREVDATRAALEKMGSSIREE